MCNVWGGQMNDKFKSFGITKKIDYENIKHLGFTNRHLIQTLKKKNQLKCKRKGINLTQTRSLNEYQK